MSNRKKWYNLPTYKQDATSNVDQYIAAWRAVAKPLEDHLGLTMAGFDPGFMFTKGNPQGTASVTVSLPLWFVLDLSRTLTQQGVTNEVPTKGL